MKIKKGFLKYFVLLILVQTCLGIKFDDIIKAIYLQFKSRHESNIKDTGNKVGFLNVERDIKVPSSMFTLFDNEIKDSFQKYVINMQNMMSLVFSSNQNLLMKELKDIIFEDIPNAQKGFDFLNPKIQKFKILIEKFYDGGFLKNFNDYFKYIDDTNIPLQIKPEDIFKLEPCNEQIGKFPNSMVFPRIIDKLKLILEQYNEEG